MAFSVNAMIDGFESQVSIDDGTTSSVAADGAFSVAADVSAFTNTENSPTCVMVLKCQFATQPTAGANINIYARKMDIDGTNDSPEPDANNLDQIIGRFVVDGTVASATDAYLVTNWMTLPNHYSGQIYEFYIQNNADQAISASWTLKITQTTKEPKI